MCRVFFIKLIFWLFFILIESKFSIANSKNIGYNARQIVVKAIPIWRKYGYI